jgi:hypothetical protein
MNDLKYRENIINTHNVKNINECIKLINSRDNKKINEGRNGIIFLIKSHNCGYVILKKFKQLNYDKIINEITMHNKITDIINNNICPNFVNFYGTNYNGTNTINKNTYILMEYADESFHELSYQIKHKYKRIMKTMIFQILIGLYCMHNLLKIQHNDLHSNNIFYKKINENTVFKYTINNKSYYIPTYGYLFMIGDFGSTSELNKKKNIDNISLFENVLFKKIIFCIRHHDIKKYDDILNYFKEHNVDATEFHIYMETVIKEMNIKYIKTPPLINFNIVKTAYKYIIKHNLFDIQKLCGKKFYSVSEKMKKIIDYYNHNNNIEKLLEKYFKKNMLPIKYTKEFIINYKN